MKRSREPEDDQAVLDSEDDEDLGDIKQGDNTDTPPSKIVEIGPKERNSASAAMTCLLHPKKLSFDSYQEYESHYNKAHLNRCLECRKNFPSAHLLSLHIEECHDAFAAAKRDKGEHTYSCFVEDCERKCASPAKRRLHSIDKHMYPRNFFFDVTKFGIDGRNSLLLDARNPHRRRKSSVSIKKEARRKSGSAEAGTGAGAEELEANSSQPASKTLTSDDATERPDVDMDDLTGAMSSLRFVPPSVRFGRGGRAGFTRRQ